MGELRVILPTGKDFVTTIRASRDGVLMDWPAGTVLVLTFRTSKGFELSATAEIDGSYARWTIPRATADTIPASASATISVSFPGIPDFDWVKGSVERP